jgi:hypothetical protein
MTSDVVEFRRLDVVGAVLELLERQKPQMRERRAIGRRGRVVRFVDDHDRERVMVDQPEEPAELHRRERLNARDDDVAIAARLARALLDVDDEPGIRAPDLVGRLVEQLLAVRDDEHLRAAGLWASWRAMSSIPAT